MSLNLMQLLKNIGFFFFISNSHFLIHIALRFMSHGAHSVDWKVAISSEAANIGLTVFGHVARCLAHFFLPTIKTHSPYLVKELQILSSVCNYQTSKLTLSS